MAGACFLYCAAEVAGAVCSLHSVKTSSRGHLHRSSSGTPASASSMCWPQPAQVGRPHTAGIRTEQPHGERQCNANEQAATSRS